MAGTVTEIDVREALRKVMDPELNRDLVSLGMAKNIAIENSKVTFDLVLTTPACPLKAQITESARAAVADLPGVSTVMVNVTSQVPSAPRLGDNPVPSVRNIIAVASGKGGVGKSTVSVNLATALAESGARVGLLDADVYGPSIPLMLGINKPPRMTGEQLEPLTAYGFKVMSLGFLLPEDTPVIWRGPLVTGTVRQLLKDVAWGELDYLVIDLPPGTGDASLTVAQLISLTGVVIVTTPQDVSLADAIKALNMFRKLNVRVLGIIENMSYFMCPHCHQRTDIFSHGGGKEASRRLGVPFLGEIPLNPQVRVGGDEGIPIVKFAPSSLEAEKFREVASLLAARVSLASVGQLP